MLKALHDADEIMTILNDPKDKKEVRNGYEKV